VKRHAKQKNGIIEFWCRADEVDAEIGRLAIEASKLRSANHILEDIRVFHTAEIERLKQSLNAKLADHINGTPCEQIRHKQEVDALQAENERLKSNLRYEIAWKDQGKHTIAELDAEIERLRSDIRTMIEKAAAKHLPAYREQGAKMVELEKKNERLRDLIKSMGTGYDDAAIDAAIGGAK
jgi:septal ring factor EnvC (AmiA/AmiB activator)